MSRQCLCLFLCWCCSGCWPSGICCQCCNLLLFVYSSSSSSSPSASFLLMHDWKVISKSRFQMIAGGQVVSLITLLLGIPPPRPQKRFQDLKSSQRLQDITGPGPAAM